MRESEGECEGRKEREATQAQRTEGKEVRTHLALHLVGVRECQGERGREGARRRRQREEVRRGWREGIYEHISHSIWQESESAREQRRERVRATRGGEGERMHDATRIAHRE